MKVQINQEIEKIATKYKVLVNLLNKKCLMCHNRNNEVDTEEIKQILLEMSNEVASDIVQLVRIEGGIKE